MKKIFLARKNPVSHYAFVTPVKPISFEGAFLDYPDETAIVEVELEDVEHIIGKELVYGDIVEVECTDEQFDEMFN